MYEASVSISDTGPRAGFENIQKPCIVAIRPQKLYLVEPQCEWSFRSLGYCKSRDELVDRAALACTLDRLTMLSAGGDTKLAGLFARAEIKRTFCGQRNPILAATPERNVAVAMPRGVKPGVGLRGRLPAH